MNRARTATFLDKSFISREKRYEELRDLSHTSRIYPYKIKLTSIFLNDGIFFLRYSSINPYKISIPQALSVRMPAQIAMKSICGLQRARTRHAEGIHAQTKKKVKHCNDGPLPSWHTPRIDGVHSLLKSLSHQITASSPMRNAVKISGTPQCVMGIKLSADNHHPSFVC